MSAPEPTYRKLPGRGLGWSGFARIWIAEEHLLEVNSLLVSERYRRFFLRDISALVIRRTKVGLAWNIVHGVLGLGGALLAGGLWWGSATADQGVQEVLQVLAVMTSPLAALFLVLFSINLLLGPTCRCHLQTTTAGWHALTAPTRLGPARRFLARLAPLIEAAQAAPAPPPLATEPSR